MRFECDESIFQWKIQCDIRDVLCHSKHSQIGWWEFFDWIWYDLKFELLSMFNSITPNGTIDSDMTSIWCVATLMKSPGFWRDIAFQNAIMITINIQSAWKVHASFAIFHANNSEHLMSVFR